MPKNIDATRTKMRPKSTKKPLRDISNASNSVKPPTFSKKSSKAKEQEVGDDSLDRLLLVHSDISSLLRQIDELVVQAIQVTGKKERTEINQFADVLSEMQDSLKPWVPRFQKAISNQTIEAENKSGKPEGISVISPAKEDTSTVVGSPEPTKFVSLVSPSPLVSWRAECNIEGGRQLFLLTPLPQAKSFMSKSRVSSIAAGEKLTLDEIVEPVSLVDNIRSLSKDMPESLPIRPAPNKALDLELPTTTENIQTECAAPSKLTTNKCSMFVMSPCLKMSPPKSCILLEPVSTFCKKKNPEVFRSTPYPTRVKDTSESPDSESCSIEISDQMNLKYPELFGITLTQNVQDRAKKIENSNHWVVSPPQSCAIMEPSDEELLENQPGECTLLQTSVPTQYTSCSIKETHNVSVTKNRYQDIIRKLDIAESTPLMNEPESCYRMGKRPGENTLKKELWTKFEAATTQGARFNGAILQKTAQKGFLDQLEEASDV